MRRIHRTEWQSRNDVRDIVQAIFVSEMISPSRCIWIVSPWITDVAVIDNRTATFDGLNPEWGAREWRLSEILGYLLERGTVLRIATRPSTSAMAILPRLRETAMTLELTSEEFEVFEREELHEKGILGDDYYLHGSMNMTHNGVQLLDELVDFEVSAEAVAGAHLAYFHEWRGILPGIDS